VSLGWKLYEQRYRIEGVVVEPKVEVRSGPGPENVAVFTIHEGTRLQVRGRNADWLQVSLPNGWSGWVPSGSAWLLTAD
jgi:uncharacterized protein YraI